MNKRTVLNLLATVTSAVTAQSALALELVPSHAGVPLLSKAEAGAPVLANLQTKDTLEVVSRSGVYWIVKWHDQKGFVRASEVQNANSGAGVNSALRSAITKSKDGNSGARTRPNAVMGIRGLDDGEQGVVDTNGAKPNPNITKSMEERHTSPGSVSAIEKSVNSEVEKKSATATP